MEINNFQGLHPYTRLGHMEALEGAVILERKLDVIANNMANIDTVGFKKQGITFAEHLLSQVDGTKRTAKGELGWTNFAPGNLRVTGNPLDFAIEGKGFFVIDTPNGKMYTRAGNFTLDAQNQLVTQEGYPVLGNGAPIVLEDTTGKGLWLSGDGRFFVDSTQTGAIDVVSFDNPQALQRMGGNLFSAPPRAGAAIPVDARVKQGYLEDSNVNPLETMIQLIDVYRSYEVQQKALQTVDQMDNQAASEVGKPS